MGGKPRISLYARRKLAFHRKVESLREEARERLRKAEEAKKAAEEAEREARNPGAAARARARARVRHAKIEKVKLKLAERNRAEPKVKRTIRKEPVRQPAPIKKRLARASRSLVKGSEGLTGDFVLDGPDDELRPEGLTGSVPMVLRSDFPHKDYAVALIFSEEIFGAFNVGSFVFSLLLEQFRQGFGDRSPGEEWCVWWLDTTTEPYDYDVAEMWFAFSEDVPIDILELMKELPFYKGCKLVSPAYMNTFLWACDDGIGLAAMWD